MDWGKVVGPLLQQTAPAIAGILVGEIPIVGPLLQGITKDAVGALIAKQFGVEPTPEAVGKAIQDSPSDVAVAKVQAAQAEAVEKWPALVEIIKAQEAGRTARFQAGTADNADARDTQIELVKAGSPIQWAPAVVSIIILLGYFAVLYILFTRPFAKIDDNYKDILIFMLGALQVGVGQVINYWLGSSAGSAGKDMALRDIAATSVVAASATPNVITLPTKAAKR